MQNYLCRARKIIAHFPADILGRDTFTGRIMLGFPAELQEVLCFSQDTV